MFTIGDFARHGRVSVRMLRHYDAIGLLRPAHVDPATGYRSYRAGQLSRLNRIVALKDLGFTLDEVRTIVGDSVGPEELRGMLRLRRSELRSRLAADAARLGQVEARLRIIEQERTMPTDDIQVTALPAVRVAERTGLAAGFEPASIGPVITPLYAELIAALDRAGVTPTGPALARYEDAPDGGVVVHAGLLARWIEAHGYVSTGYNRELYLAYGDGADDAVQLQEPVRTAWAGRSRAGSADLARDLRLSSARS